jgi:hypothetical protein
LNSGAIGQLDVFVKTLDRASKDVERCVVLRVPKMFRMLVLAARPQVD